jgi:peptide-methionine (S)-S-oxide reductase
MGCFWGAERKFWQAPGVYSTAVGYAGGHTPNPTYREVCSGMTGHTEVVLVVFDPKKTSYDAMLKLFWENHDPTQGMRQGNDVGTQYRSAIYCYTPEQKLAAEASRASYQDRLTAAGMDASPLRFWMRRRSTTRRITTSSISTRTPTAIAASVVRASPARLGWA